MAYKDPERKREADRRWRAANIERKREADRRWNAANIERKRETQRRWNAANPEKLREAERRRRDANPEKYRAAERRWRAANPEKRRAAQRRRQAANPEKQRAAARRRRAANPEKHREAARRLNQRLAAEAFAAYGGKCVCCEDTENLSLDHIRSGQPPEDFNGSGRRRRASDVIRARLKKAGWPKDQIQVLCRYCNARKGDKNPACPCGGLGSPAQRRRNASKATTP